MELKLRNNTLIISILLNFNEIYFWRNTNKKVRFQTYLLIWNRAIQKSQQFRRVDYLFVFY